MFIIPGALHPNVSQKCLKNDGMNQIYHCTLGMKKVSKYKMFAS